VSGASPSERPPEHTAVVGRFRRVVLALDASAGDPSAMERAATLAARLHGELMALLVEDIDLMRLAQHSSVCTFSTVSAMRQDVATDHLRDLLRLQAVRLRRQLEQIAAHRQVKCDFQVRQGRLLAEVMNAASDEDLVVISWPAVSTAPWENSPPPTAVAQALAEARVRSVLLLHPKTAAEGPVLIAYDGSETSRHALAVAAQVAVLDGATIEVALLAASPGQAQVWSADIVTALADTRPRLVFLHTPKADVRTLIEIVAARRSALLVLGANRALAESETSHRLLQRIPCAVLLVR
jgi:nucleotide-binding universal stress UspA family protein